MSDWKNMDQWYTVLPPSRPTLEELNRIELYLDNIERNGSQTNYNSNDSISNKYVCTIEGNVDENGVVVQVNSSNNYSKFVFVCEYRP